MTTPAIMAIAMISARVRQNPDGIRSGRRSSATTSALYVCLSYINLVDVLRFTVYPSNWSGYYGVTTFGVCKNVSSNLFEARFRGASPKWSASSRFGAWGGSSSPNALGGAYVVAHDWRRARGCG